MRIGIKGCLIVAGLLIFNLADGSGQDAYPHGLRAQYAVAAGRLAEGLQLYQSAHRVAEAASLPEVQHRLLNNIGACQLALFRYKDAVQTLLRVRMLADQSHNQALLGGADGNLASVYMQMDDFRVAEMYARESLQAYSRTDEQKLRARAMMTLAEILSRRKLTPEADRYFRRGIETATGFQDWSSASAGWLHYGSILLEGSRFRDADLAFTNSHRLLRKSGHLSGEYAVLWKLSMLRFREGDRKTALALVNSAIRNSPASGGRISPRRLYQTRAEIELAGGDAPAALRDARLALQSARSLRANIVPDDDNRIGMEGVLDEGFSLLIDAGNQVYLKTGDPKLVEETFEAVEENRAESLEALLPSFSDWRASVSTPEYRYKLSQLLREQRMVLRMNSQEARNRMARIQAELSQMEAGSGATVLPQTGTVLDRVKRNLPPGAALLSFRLGDRASWLWTVDHGRLHLYRLPRKVILQAQIRDFQAAIHDNDIERANTTGRRLYRDLFGNGRRSVDKRGQWFISLDEPLYTLAFPSLVVEVNKNGPVYLTQRKTLQVLPGRSYSALPIGGSFGNRRFLLAGDGIYNRADPRFGRSGLIRTTAWGMPRLPGSGAEVRFAAELWRHAALLTGARMTKESLLREIDRDPDVIHIASHVVEGQDRWHTGILALGMDPSGEPDLLTPKEIQLHPLHARLVVMSGCSSGSGETLPASGLMGLTRAWLAAGAGEVLATRWPTRDESGEGLIGSFYLHLLASPDGDIPEALRAARRDMIARGGWRAEPRYWSSFFLVGVR